MGANFSSSIDNVGSRDRAFTYGQKLAKIAGKSILLAGFLVALASVEMSSRFSVLNFAKDDEILQNAANALSAFMFIGVFWAIGSTAVLFSSYGWPGVLAGVLSNGLILTWIYCSYRAAFSRAALERNLTEPTMWKTFI